MADKYIWHNLSVAELNSWAERYGHTDEQRVEVTTGTEEYDVLCQIFGCTAISNSPLIMIYRDRWYIQGQRTFTFNGTIAALHIRTRSGEDIRESNISSYEFVPTGTDEYSNSIAEFNITTRLKTEGYGWREPESTTETFPLKETWNGHYKIPVLTRKGSIVEDGVNEDEHKLYPFKSVKNCVITGYCNSEEDQEGSIIGTVFSGELLNPQKFPIGTPLSTTGGGVTPGYAYNYGMGYNGLGTTPGQDHSRMWNLCLYPLVLVDSSASHSNVRKIEIDKNTNKLRVVVNESAVTKWISFNPDTDCLIAYTQSAASCNCVISPLLDGLSTEPVIPYDSIQVFWQDSRSGGDCGSDITIKGHVNVFLRLDLTLDFGTDTNLRYLKWSEASTGDVYNSNDNSWGSYWKDVNNQSDDLIVKNIPLFTSFSSEWGGGNSSVSIPKTGYFAAVSKGNKTAYKASESSTSGGQREEFWLNDDENVDPYTTEKQVNTEGCCGGCTQSTFVWAKLKFMVAETSLTIRNKKSLSSDTQYLSYLDYWFGDNARYWHSEQNTEWYPTYESRPIVTAAPSFDITSTYHGTAKNMQIEFYLDNFYYNSISSNNIKDADLKIPVGDTTVVLDLEDTTIKPIVNGSAASKYGEEAVIVLWTANIPEADTNREGPGILCP